MLLRLLEFANYLADEAALISRKYFRQSLSIECKANHTPVTIADREIELRLRELITIHYPTHGIIGEEFANTLVPLSHEWCWVLDPIDGTVAFTTGKPTFTTLIALLHWQQPVLSVIDQAISRERFCAHERAYLNQQLLSTSPISNLAAARLNATTPYMFKTSYEQAVFEQVRRQVKVCAFGGDAYAFGLLAAGQLELIVEADLEYYDVAALIPLIKASGGLISDWQGNPLRPDFNGQCLACANLELQQQIVALVNYTRVKMEY